MGIVGLVGEIGEFFFEGGEIDGGALEKFEERLVGGSLGEFGLECDELGELEGDLTGESAVEKGVEASVFEGFGELFDGFLFGCCEGFGYCGGVD